MPAKHTSTFFELDDSKAFIKDNLIIAAEDLLMFIHSGVQRKTPHWRKNLISKCEQVKLVLEYSHKVEEFITYAKNYFSSKTNSRSYNVLFTKIPIYRCAIRKDRSLDRTRDNVKRVFHYYLGISFRKKRIKRMMYYDVVVGPICTYGRTIHLEVPFTLEQAIGKNELSGLLPIEFIVDECSEPIVQIGNEGKVLKANVGKIIITSTPNMPNTVFSQFFNQKP